MIDTSHLSDLKLLVVDDEPDVLDSIRRLFRKKYTLRLAQSPTEALSILEREEINLVMSDQRMPAMSGVELLSRAKQLQPDAVRMLITGYGGDETAIIAAINGGEVYRYIHKPFDPEELKAIVQQAAEHHTMRTERARLFAELEEKYRQLDVKNRDLERAYECLQVQSRLKGVAMEVLSHELNTPAAVILGYTALIRRGAIKPGAQAWQTAIDGIENSGRRLKGISEKLSKVMVSDNPRMRLHREPISARWAVGLVADRLAPILEMRSQRLEVVEHQANLELEANPDFVHDILMHLLVNAIKFSPDGSSIWVELAASIIEDHPAVEFKIRDEGVGIHPEDREQIFTSFFGTFRSRHHSSGEFGFEQRGLGLGLAIVKNFVRIHGGLVEFESELGEGSEFKVTLPLKRLIPEIPDDCCCEAQPA